MNQVEELVKVVAEAQADKGNVVIVTGKPGSGKSKVLREAAESQKWTYVDCRMLISEEFLAIPAADRGLYAPDMFADILASYNADVIILDRLQTLFIYLPLSCKTVIANIFIIKASVFLLYPAWCFPSTFLPTQFFQMSQHMSAHSATKLIAV